MNGIPPCIIPQPVPIANHMLGTSKAGPTIPITSGLQVIGPATTLAMFASANTGIRSIAAAVLSLILSRSLSNSSFPKPGVTPSHLQICHSYTVHQNLRTPQHAVIRSEIKAYNIIEVQTYYCGRHSDLTTPNQVVRGFKEHWPETLCCFLGQDTSLLQCLSPSRCINGYQKI